MNRERTGRTAGVLVHPTSFPSRYGIGDFGASAYHFLDFLAAAGQKLWQVLPLGPTSYGDSPYQCLSALAGNPMLISPDRLKEQGLLTEEHLRDVPAFPADKVDYGWVIPWKKKLLGEAHALFKTKANDHDWREYHEFCHREGHWLEDFATFAAIKEDLGGRPWIEWPQALALRHEDAIQHWKTHNGNALDFQKFLQFQFAKQWLALKEYANLKGIKIIGDLPIFVAYDSADVWSNQGVFQLDEKGHPMVVAGVPPDYFSATGQRWGNPLYHWDKMRANDYAWWQLRFRTLFAQCDIIRIDHFRGFETYWEIPASEPTAVKGRWLKGPDHHFFQVMREKLGELPIIAEDLGDITPEVDILRLDFGFPGMKILQFAFGEDKNNPFRPHHFEKNTVVYTGTHDNNTTRGWFREASEAERERLRRYVGQNITEESVAACLITMAWASTANVALAPLQDILNLNEEARMNFPSKAAGNWMWRYRPETLTESIRAWMASLSKTYERFGQ